MVSQEPVEKPINNPETKRYTSEFPNTTCNLDKNKSLLGTAKPAISVASLDSISAVAKANIHKMIGTLRN